MRYIQVHTSNQTLELKQGKRVLRQYRISSANNGLGEQQDSLQTPRGWHRIYAKVGAGADEQAVFTSRQASGEIYSATLAEMHPQRDWILTRILWLEGLEAGRNQGGQVDTLSRYIYIHGTAEVESLGTACSQGCIRMSPRDIKTLFDHIDVHSNVLIE